MNRRLKFYKRIRNTVLALRTKSNDRIVLDFIMAGPLVSSKGINIKSNSVSKRNAMRRSRTLQNKRSIKIGKNI